MLYLLVDTAILMEFLRCIFQNFRLFLTSFRQNRCQFYYTYVYFCYIARYRQIYRDFWII